MSLNLDRSSWKRVTLRDVVRHITDRVDPETSGLERFLAGEHIPSTSLTITSWGVVGEDPIGPMFYKRFKPGHVLYVSRRTYLRKVAVPEFEGITGEKTFVLETTDPSELLQEFLPFVLSNERFHEYAVANSRGSVNPYLNWGELSNYEFPLPPVEEQKRIADLLWAIEAAKDGTGDVASAIAALYTVTFEFVASSEQTTLLSSWVERIDAGRSPRAAAEPAQEGELGVLKVSAVGRDVFVPDENKRLLDPTDFRPGDSVRSGDVLVTRANAVVDNVARACIVDRDFPKLMLSDKTLRLVPKIGYPGRILLAALSAPSYRSYVREVVNGTEAKNISQAKILAGPVPALDRSALRRLAGALMSLDAAADATSSEIAGIVVLKASLLAEIFGDA